MIYFLSGLPRTGSTLLTSILYQNPLIHTEGSSNLCDLMWQSHVSLQGDAIAANNRQLHAHQMVADLPARYYSHITRPVVIDKCRAWTMQPNVEMLRKYVTPTPKIVVMTRNPADIISSFKSLFERNGRDDFDTSGIVEEFNHNMVGLKMTQDANDPDTFLFVDYDDLIKDTQSELNRIYGFFELQPFEHDLFNIQNSNQEDDSVHGLVGMHDVRKTILRRTI